MEGYFEVSYTVMCDNDFYKEISLEALLANEKVAKAIKSEFAKGVRNLELKSACNEPVVVRTAKEVFTFRARKDDFADLLELAEEDARKHKRLKKECEGVALVDIVTVDKA
jgi:hypothetical protein